MFESEKQARPEFFLQKNRHCTLGVTQIWHKIHKIPIKIAEIRNKTSLKMSLKKYHALGYYMSCKGERTETIHLEENFENLHKI